MRRFLFLGLVLAALAAGPARADKKVSDLPAAPSALAGDRLLIARAGANLTLTPADLAAYTAAQVTGDCTFTLLAITCGKTGGTAFGPFATRTDGSWSSGTDVTASTFGNNQGGGSGMIGIGVAPHSGVSLNVSTPVVDNLTATGAEVWAVGGKTLCTPTSTVGSAAACFGAVINSTWDGSFDNGANALNYGAQFIGYVSGTASVQRDFGMEAEAVLLGTGTITTMNGAWVHVGTTGAGAVTTADVLRIDASNSGAATFGALNGIHIPAMSLAAAGSNAALRIDGQAAADYAIRTGTGITSLGGTLTVAGGSTFAGGIWGVTPFGDGASNAASISENCASGQGSRALTIQSAGGGETFGISCAGSLALTQDTNFKTTTAIFQDGSSVQKVRLRGSNTGAQAAFASDACAAWSSTTAASGTPDVRICRKAANVLAIGTTAAGGDNGTLDAGAYQAGGVAGVSCSGTPSASFAVVGGIVTHC